MGRGLGRGQDTANFSDISKDAQENSTSFDTNIVLGVGGANMVWNEKPRADDAHFRQKYHQKFIIKSEKMNKSVKFRDAL